MNLEEIVNRDTNLEVTQEECLFVLKEYVRIRKGKDINPVIITSVPTIFIQDQLIIMSKLSIYAITWLKNNPTIR